MRWTDRHFRQARNGAPSVLEKRKRSYRAVCDPPPLRIADLGISITEPHLHHFPAGFAVVGRFPENGNTERVASGPGDGEASDRRLEAVAERVHDGVVRDLRQERDYRAVGGSVAGGWSDEGHFAGEERVEVAD